jgi:hypothetical protein
MGCAYSLIFIIIIIFFPEGATPFATCLLHRSVKRRLGAASLDAEPSKTIHFALYFGLTWQIFG